MLSKTRYVVSSLEIEPFGILNCQYISTCVDNKFILLIF